MTSERPLYHGSSYVTSRPTYPRRMYDIIEAYHRAGGAAFEHVLDLGCGPGFMALELAKSFDKVTGLDPMESMVAAGLQPKDKVIQYGVGSAENLQAAGIPDDSVDMAVAGEAAHYFDHDKTWPELARVLKPAGTVAWVGYGRISFPNHTDANQIINQLMDDTLKPYWSEPGWSISEGLYDRIPFPVVPNANRTAVEELPDLAGSGHPINSYVEEIEQRGSGQWDPASALRLKSGTTAGEWFLNERWSLQQLENCLRSWSSVKRFHTVNPDDKVAEKDIINRVISKLAPILGTEFDVAWPMVIMMIRLKP